MSPVFGRIARGGLASDVRKQYLLVQGRRFREAIPVHTTTFPTESDPDSTDLSERRRFRRDVLRAADTVTHHLRFGHTGYRIVQTDKQDDGTYRVTAQFYRLETRPPRQLPLRTRELWRTC